MRVERGIVADSTSSLKASTTRERADAPLFPFTRKYIGSKRQLRDWIADRICGLAGTPRSFLDGFFGTGAISCAMAQRGAGRIIAVDALRSNCVILRGFLSTSDRVGGLIETLNELPGRRGYISDNYAGTYFTEENCRRMDATRQRIEQWRRLGEITAGEHDILLAGFLLAADRIANTIGQYDAFLKNIDAESMVNGKHMVDDRVKSPFLIKPVDPLPRSSIEVVEADMILYARDLNVDVAYFDPPYNQRQYCDNYHVLENLARWERPPLFGKTRKFDRTGLRSPFSSTSQAPDALRTLMSVIQARHVFLSYSSEGILSESEIMKILSERGSTEVMHMPYPVFGNGAGVSSRRSVIEYLFHMQPEQAN
jgi:adenine-specific DNA-methyltransferase